MISLYFTHHRVTKDTDIYQNETILGIGIDQKVSKPSIHVIYTAFGNVSRAVCLGIGYSRIFGVQ